jgi:uncharacterized membrane protein
MAALAYLLPPVSGLIGYFTSSDARTRRHGLQSVLFGFLWPAALYAGSAVTPGATQIAFFVGAALWVVLLAATALGRDPHLPGTGRVFERWAAESPR